MPGRSRPSGVTQRPRCSTRRPDLPATTPSGETLEISPPRHQLQVDSASFDSVLPPGRGTIRAVARPLTDINGERRRAHMIPALTYDEIGRASCREGGGKYV